MLFGNTALGYTAKDLNKPSNKTAIGSFYKQYLGRQADAGGIAHYQSLMNKGASLSSIQNSIRGSQEARDRYSEGIKQASQQALGRNMGTSGVESFTNAVASGQGSLAQAVDSIYGSREGQQYATDQSNKAAMELIAAERAFTAEQNAAGLAAQAAQQASEQRFQREQQEKQAQLQLEAEARQTALQREAEVRQAERLKEMEIGQRTQAANTARAGLQSQFQISSGSKSNKTAGTQGFKRRKLQVNPATYNAVSSSSPSSTSKPGVLNV